MKVLKHGNMSYYHETDHTCETCGCEFRFTLADISFKLDYSAEVDKYTSCNYIICPECKAVYILNQEEDNPQPTPDPDPQPTPDPEPTPDPLDPLDPNGGD